MREGWKVIPLKDVGQVVNGGTPNTKISEYWDGEHLWITPAEMSKLQTPYLSKSRRKLSDAGLKKSSATLVPPKSIILSTRAPIGHLAINSAPMAFNQGCRALVPNSGTHYKYLFYFLLGNIELLNELGTGTTFKELSATKLKNIKVPVPPFPEQKRIVAILDEAFAGIEKAIANTEKNLVNARELFESYLNSIFYYKGEGWIKSTLGEIYDVRDGTHDSPKYQKAGRALVTSKNLKNGKLNFDKVKYISEKDYLDICRRSCVHNGDVLFAMIGTIGNPIVVEVEPDFAIKNVALFKIPENHSGYFLKYYLLSSEVEKKMDAEAKGTTQRFVGLGYLRDFPIWIPDTQEELNIVESLFTFEQETQRLESIYQQKLTALAELKQSLLQKAFSGELMARANNHIDKAAA